MNEVEALGIDFTLGALGHFTKGHKALGNYSRMGYNADCVSWTRNMYIRHKIFHEV